MTLMLQEVGEPQRARREAETGQIGAIGPQLAPHQRFVHPGDRVVLEREHRERKHVRGDAAILAGDEDRVRRTAPACLERVGRAVILPRDEHDGRCLDDVAVLDRALPGDAGGVGADRVGGELDRPQAEHEQARAAAQRRLRPARQAEARRELFRRRDVGQRHADLARQQHQFARGRDAVTRRNHDRPRLSALAHRQAERHAAAGRLAEVGLTREEVLLVADEIARGEEPAVEIARPLAPRVLDEHAGAAKGRQILCRDALARGAVDQSHRSFLITRSAHARRQSIGTAAAPTE